MLERSELIPMRERHPELVPASNTCNTPPPQPHAQCPQAKVELLAGSPVGPNRAPMKTPRSPQPCLGRHPVLSWRVVIRVNADKCFPHMVRYGTDLCRSTRDTKGCQARSVARVWCGPDTAGPSSSLHATHRPTCNENTDTYIHRRDQAWAGEGPPRHLTANGNNS